MKLPAHLVSRFMLRENHKIDIAGMWSIVTLDCLLTSRQRVGGHKPRRAGAATRRLGNGACTLWTNHLGPRHNLSKPFLDVSLQSGDTIRCGYWGGWGRRKRLTMCLQPRGHLTRADLCAMACILFGLCQGLVVESVKKVHDSRRRIWGGRGGWGHRALAGGEGGRVVLKRTTTRPGPIMFPSHPTSSTEPKGKVILGSKDDDVHDVLSTAQI